MRLQITRSAIAIKTSEMLATALRGSGKSKVDVKVFKEDLSIPSWERGGMLVLAPQGTEDYSAELAKENVVYAESFEDEIFSIVSQKKSFFLARGKFSKPLVDSGSKVSLAKLKPSRIDWPKKLIWDHFEDQPDELYEECEKAGNSVIAPLVTVNQHGVVVTCSQTGIIAALQRGSHAFDSVLRVPSQCEGRLIAELDQDRIVVTFATGMREGAILVLNPEGKVLFSKQVYEPIPAIVLKSGILYQNNETVSETILIDRAFRERGKWDFIKGVDSAHSPDGELFAIAGQDTLYLCKFDEDKNLSIESKIEYLVEFRQQRRMKSEKEFEETYFPRSVKGEPSVGFASGKKFAPWTASVASKFELALPLQSMAGEGRGLKIQITGKALESIKLSGIRFNNQAIPLAQKDGNYSAEMPDFEIQLAPLQPFDPAPKNTFQTNKAHELLERTQFEMHLIGIAEKVSNDLLSVTVSVMNSSASPLKSVRPLKIK